MRNGGARRDEYGEFLTMAPDQSEKMHRRRQEQRARKELLELLPTPPG